MVNNLPRMANKVSTMHGRFLRQLLVLLRDNIPAQGLVLVLRFERSLIRSLLRAVCQSRVRVGQSGFELGLTSHLCLRERFGSRVANLRGVLGVATLGEDDFRVLTNLASKCRKRRF